MPAEQPEATSPPTEVITRIARGRSGPARTRSAWTPTALPISTAASSNVPRFAGPAGIAEASATPDASSDAWPIVSSTPIAWPAAANARIGRAPGDDAQEQRLGQRPRPAGHAQPVAQLADQVPDPRVALRRRGDPLGAGQPMGGDPDRDAGRQQPGNAPPRRARRSRRGPGRTARGSRPTRSRRRRRGRRPARRRPSRASSSARCPRGRRA